MLEDELQYAIQQEVLALVNVSGATVLLHTDFKADKWPSYNMPLILITLEEGGDSKQFLGGLTQEDINITFSVYTHRPDISGMDPTGTSAENVAIWTTVRRHFSNFAVPQSAELKAFINTYGFRVTYLGKSEAVSLEHPDGLCMGKSYIFGSVCFDDGTVGINPDGPALDPSTMQQIAPLPAGEMPLSGLHQLDPSPSPEAPYSPVARQ